MSTGSKWNKFNGTLLIGVALLWVAAPKVVLASDAQDQQAATPKKVSRAKTATKSHAKAKKPALPPLPSGPTGPVQQVPLDSIAAVPPQVSYENNQLTIVAPNSTLADILRAVRKQTGAEIEIPSAPERVVTHLGPGPAREVVAELLNGSRFNYVLLGSPGNEAQLTRVVLVAKTGSDTVGPATGPSLAEQQQRGIASASRLLQELPVARDLGFREARRGPFPQFRLQASLKQLLHQLWRRISVQNITGGHADLDAIFTYLQLKNRAALIIDASLRLGLQLLPYLVDIRSRLVRKGAGQKVF